MLRQLTSRCSTIITPLICHSAEKVHSHILGERPLLINFPSHTFLRTFLDLHQFHNKDAIAKERARLSDEISRGYFADMSEIHKNHGKIALANKTIIPSLIAAKFPNLEINFSDGRCEKLPSNPEQRINDSSQTALPCVTLLSLSFRASSQKMVESWSLPVLNAFGDAGTVKIYEVSFIDSWLFSLSPVKRLFLKIMLKSSNPQRQIAYSFGDHYYFRKNLQILNLLTGYTFLLDSSGCIRWQGYGYATEEEISWLLSCISLLLDEK
ncbi:uncharacterized protein LOC121997370 [Zingiber officinale]|uniref:AT1G08220-like protein n=1 Tax=Zingiber officinale TaxID=94328 RepID=A0A8J5G5I6_ZINOF|nr:uncharacterized protein LOC121997370 [Zingiber officinale]XP_042407678.1 uncharacterized protein LOC121997370 [Zingiber officinale]KAG6500820.1 hypothetical protein ZIOFF_040675 [Zingiber officinale]